jgi:hypothetical protein
VKKSEILTSHLQRKAHFAVLVGGSFSPQKISPGTFFRRPFVVQSILDYFGDLRKIFETIKGDHHAPAR